MKLLVWMAAAAAALGALAQNLPEVTIDGDDFKRLDAFEAQRMQEADKSFAARNYRQAAAAYEAFIQEFGKSEALPYAMLKKGRSLQLDGKRFEAIRVYEGEVLDYFPDTVRYAAPALYYVGECHWQNGDVKEAMKAWAEMADDTEYCRHFLAAPALNALAQNLNDQGKPGEAVKYWWKVAENFRSSTRDSARAAMNNVIAYYIRTEPDAAKLAEFYKAAGTFEWDPRDPDRAKPDLYWRRVMENIGRHGQFNDAQRDLKIRFYAYWAKVFADAAAKDPSLAEWDDFQYSRICYQRQADGDDAKWVKEIDDLFERNRKPGETDRVVSFLEYYARDRKRPKFDEYYGKLDFEKMSPGAIERLVRVIYDNGVGEDMGRNAFSHLPLAKMDDNAKYHFGRWMWHKDEQPLEALYASFENTGWGRMELLRYYEWRKNLEKGLKLADEIAAAFPDSAREALFLKGQILQHHGRFEDAIKAYRSSENHPHDLYRMAECLQRLGKPDSAIAQYRELENFFPDQAPEAALRIAWVRRDAGDQKQFIAALRAVMKKYPNSGQSSAAHQELEKLGVSIGGGVGAD